MNLQLIKYSLITKFINEIKNYNIIFFLISETTYHFINFTCEIQNFVSNYFFIKNKINSTFKKKKDKSHN